MTKRFSREVRTPAPPLGGSVASGKGCVWLPLCKVGLRSLCATAVRPLEEHPGRGRQGVRRASGPAPVSAGVASVLVSFFLCTYYNVINAWAFWYLFHSFQVSGRGLGQERAGGGRAPRAEQRASEPGIRGPLRCVRCVRTFLGSGPTDFIGCALKDVTPPPPKY